MANRACADMMKNGLSAMENIDDLLDEERYSSELLGHTMWWKDFDKILIKTIFKNVNIEYRALKFMFWQTVFFLLLVISITGYSIVLQDGPVYEVKQEQTRYWSGCHANGTCAIDGVKSRTQFWNWFQTDLPDLVWTTNKEYSTFLDVDFPQSLSVFELSEKSSAWSPRYVTDTKTAIQLGAIRVRQWRVRRNDRCKTQDYYAGVQPHCFPKYSREVESRKTYAKAWTPEAVHHAYVHNPANVTRQQGVEGIAASYPGNAFFWDMSVNKTRALSQVRNLMEWDYIDDATRAIALEINVYNPNLNVIIMNELLFEFTVEGTVETRHNVNAFRVMHLSMSLLQTDASTVFVFMVLSCAVTCVFTLLNAFCMYKSGIKYYFSYIWNVLDFAIMVLSWWVLALRLGVFGKVKQEPALAPELVAHPDIFMPYNVVVADLHLATDLSSLLIMFVWLKLLKYLGLTTLFRTHVHVIEIAIVAVLRFAIFLGSIFMGFAIALNIGFGDRVPMYATLSGSFFSLFFWLTGGTDLTPLFQNGNALGPALYFLFLILVFMLLGNLFMALVLDLYTFTRFENRTKKGKLPRQNPMGVFLYTYWHKLKGEALVGVEAEDAVGSADEQYIMADQLPGVVVQAIEEQKAKCEDLLENPDIPPQMLDENHYKGSTASRSVGHSVSGPMTLRTLKEGEYSRIQLQRLLDENAELRQLLGTDQAVKVIRCFKRVKMPDAWSLINKLQTNVFSTMDQIEKADYNLPMTHKQSLRQVASGLHEAINDIQNMWRGELSGVLEVANALSENLAVLTKRLERCQLNHQNIAQNLQADQGVE
eukprot:gene327-1124_t